MKKSRGLARFTLIFTVFNGLIFYLGWSGWIWLNSSFGFEHSLLYGVLVAMFSYSYVIGRKSRRFVLFRTIGSFWFGFFQYGLLIIPIAGLFVLGMRLSSIPEEITIFYTGFAVIALFIGILLYGMYNAYSPIVRKHEFKISGKKSERSFLRIAMASDMHFGRLSGVRHAKRLVEKVNGLQADIILLPGDIIDDDPDPFIQKNMDKIMAGLQAPLGVYGVLGNHEYYGGQIPEYLEVMNKINIKIMLDQWVKIGDDFYLVGRKDKTDKGRMTFEELLKDIDKSYPIISMDHQPFELDKAEESGVDVILSGHTHRGQMAPNHLITKKMYELDWGYLRKGKMHAFVSSGYGFWGPPMRIGSRSEIVQIDIHFDGAGSL